MKYAFFDIDNTLYEGYTTSDFYLFLANKGYISERIYKEDKRLGKLYHSGKINYAEVSRQVVQLTAKYLKGVEVKKVGKWQREFINKNASNFFPWTNDILSKLKRSGYKIYLISAAAEPPVRAVSGFIKADKSFSSKLIAKKGVYTGMIGTMLNFEKKRDLVHRIVGHIPKARKVGFGDSSGDIDMLSHMDIAFLYKPKDKNLIKLAKDKDWIIVDEKSISEAVSKLI